MRTKTLLLAVALSAAGLATSLAQSNVYSLNVVGYYNIDTPSNGVYFVANQLHTDGTGTNNTIESVFGTNFPSGTHIYAFDYTTTMNWVSVNFLGGAWVGASRPTVTYGLQAGRGVFLQKINTGTGGPDKATFVGNVLQGQLNNTAEIRATPGGVISSMVPQTGTVTALGLVVGNTGRAVAYVHQSWEPSGSWINKVHLGAIWLAEPTLQVGEAMWYDPGTSSPASTWNRNFTVQ
jgi:hypothetical protein